MFFSKPETYNPCGIFSIGHLILFLFTTVGISAAVKQTKVSKKEEITKIIKKITITIWILEIIKTIYTISIGQGKNLNKIAPLYYCSLFLYSGALSSFGKGFIKKMGDVFLATGGIIGGFVFLLLPTTSLPNYPMFHFISFHSFFYHGTMVYLGIIINKFKYIDLKLSDIKYYSTLVFIICIIAYFVNAKYGSNLMFISQDFPGMPLSPVYHATGRWFTPLMILAQMSLPFFMIYGILKLKEKFGVSK